MYYLKKAIPSLRKLRWVLWSFLDQRSDKRWLITNLWKETIFFTMKMFMIHFLGDNQIPPISVPANIWVYSSPQRPFLCKWYGEYHVTQNQFTIILLQCCMLCLTNFPVAYSLLIWCAVIRVFTLNGVHCVIKQLDGINSLFSIVTPSYIIWHLRVNSEKVISTM